MLWGTVVGGEEGEEAWGDLICDAEAFSWCVERARRNSMSPRI